MNKEILINEEDNNKEKPSTNFIFLYYIKVNNEVSIFYSKDFIKQNSKDFTVKNRFYKGELKERILNKRDLSVNYKIKENSNLIYNGLESIFIEIVPYEDWMDVESKIAYKEFEKRKIEILLEINKELNQLNV